MESPTNIVRLRQPEDIDDPLTEVLRAGARRLLAQAVEFEAEAFLTAMHYRHTVENSVYVTQAAHRSGVGEALLHALVARCEAGPWRQMVAVIGGSANAGSIALHRKAGFTHVGTLSCGLDLATQQSGTFRGQTKLSKYGNARLRRTLWLAGQVAIRQRENGFRDKFERYIARDRHDADLRRKALTAITAKMARVVHAVIKTGADYRPFVEGPVPGGRTPLSRAVRA